MQIALEKLFPNDVVLDKLGNKFVFVFGEPEHYYFIPYNTHVKDLTKTATGGNCVLAHSHSKDEKKKIHYVYTKAKDRRFLDTVEYLENEKSHLNDNDWIVLCRKFPIGAGAQSDRSANWHLVRLKLYRFDSSRNSNNELTRGFRERWLYNKENFPQIKRVLFFNNVYPTKQEKLENFLRIKRLIYTFSTFADGDKFTLPFWQARFQVQDLFGNMVGQTEEKKYLTWTSFNYEGLEQENVSLTSQPIFVWKPDKSNRFSERDFK